MTRKTSPFICTRPQLAALLMEHGQPVQRTVNPWKPNLAAWKCELNATSAAIITEYYKSIEKEPPARVQNYLQTQGVEA